jgi:hypothetical protein
MRHGPPRIEGTTAAYRDLDTDIEISISDNHSRSSSRGFSARRTIEGIAQILTMG